MSGYNRAILMGNMTRDPEIKHTQSNTAVAKFGLAMNRKFKTAAGESREEVTFVECEAWGKVAEVIAQYHQKGSPILVEGRLKMDEWADKTTGEARSRLVVSCDRFEFVGGKDSGGGSGGSGGYSGGTESKTFAKRKPSTTAAGGHPAIDSNDIPF